MILKKWKKEKEPTPCPMELCPSFAKCSSAVCPLDPDANKRVYVSGDDSCVATKPIRQAIAAQFPELLPLKGLTAREIAGKKAWDNRNPKEKKLFVESNTRRLKKLYKSKKKAPIKRRKVAK